MTDTSQIEEMKRYLFYEMTAEESHDLEERYFEDAEFFYDLLELENDLLDSYAVGNLKGEDLKRFEKSLEKSPERCEKIADARVLQKLITEDKSKPLIVVAAPTFWEKLASFFSLQLSGLKLAAGAIVFLLICSVAFLLYQNWQAQNEFAKFERQRETERIEKENRLKQLEEQKRIEDQHRQNQLSNQQSENSNINVQQNNANRQIEDQERNNEIEKLKKEVEDEKRKNIPSSNRNEVKPSNQVLVISIPTIGRSKMGDFSPTAEVVSINGEQKIKLEVPVLLDKDYTSIKVVSKNGTDSQSIPQGAKSVIFLLPPNDTEIDIRAMERDTRRGSESLGRFELKVKKTRDELK